MLKNLTLLAAEGFTSAADFSEPVPPLSSWYSIDLISIAVVVVLVAWFSFVLKAVRVTRPPDEESRKALKELRKKPVKKRD